jgi:hypothetical protein
MIGVRRRGARMPAIATSPAIECCRSHASQTNRENPIGPVHQRSFGPPVAHCRSFETAGMTSPARSGPGASGRRFPGRPQRPAPTAAPLVAVAPPRAAAAMAAAGPTGGPVAGSESSPVGVGTRGLRRRVAKWAACPSVLRGCSPTMPIGVVTQSVRPLTDGDLRVRDCLGRLPRAIPPRSQTRPNASSTSRLRWRQRSTGRRCTRHHGGATSACTFNAPCRRNRPARCSR